MVTAAVDLAYLTDSLIDIYLKYGVCAIDQRRARFQSA